MSFAIRGDLRMSETSSWRPSAGPAPHEGYTSFHEGECTMRKAKWTLAIASLAAILVVTAASAPARAAVVTVNEVPAHDRQIGETSNGGANVGDDVLIRVGHEPAGPGSLETMFS